MKTNKTNTNKAHKVNATAAAAKDFKTFANKQFRSFSSCLRAVREAMTAKDAPACVQEFRTACRRDNLKLSDFAPAYIVGKLDGGRYCVDGVLGRYVKQEDGSEIFTAWESWTPGRVITYVLRANRASWKEYNAAVREAKKSSQNK